MASISSRLLLSLLFILSCCPAAWSDRRFSDLKRCADEECSMLLCRGKASLDFTGPDCRFLSFKKGETIYVYYKLSGQRSDVWAGSVGNSFGYFPKDFLNINHVYTDKEIEVSTEETDFVCFDTGLDKFESYDIDVLLRNSFSEKVDETSDNTEEAALSEDAVEDGETEDTNEDGIHPDSPNTEDEDEQTVETEDLRDPEMTQPPPEATSQVEDEHVYGLKKTPDADSDQERARDKDVPDEPLSKDAEVIEESDHTTPVEAFSRLETTLGTTFDAVTSDDENTQKVSPYEKEEEDEDQRSDSSAKHPVESEEEIVKEPALLTFEETNIPDANGSDFRKVDLAFSEDAAKDGEVEDTQRKVVRSERERDARKSSDSAADSDQKRAIDKDPSGDLSSKDAGVLQRSDQTTPVEAFFGLKTTLGTTFDAVTSDDEDTQKVSPDPDEDQSSDAVEEPSELEEQSLKEPSLLTFEDTSESEDKHDPHQPSASVEEKKVDGMWSTLGDTVFEIVSGGKRTDLPDDDDDDDNDDNDDEVGDDEEEEEEEEEEAETDAHSKTTEKGSDEIQTILAPDSGTSEVLNESKPSINDSEINSLDDTKYPKTEEQNTVLKSQELEVTKGKSLGLDDTFIESKPESDSLTSELENEKLVLDKSAEKHLPKPIPSAIQSDESEPEALVKEGADAVTDVDEHPDEQINTVKKDIIGLFEKTLKREQLEPGVDEEEEHEVGELLEDENALLSAYKAEETEDTIANTEPKRNKSTSEEMTHDGLETLDVSVSSPVHEDTRKSDNPNGADDTQKASAPSSEPEYSDNVMRLMLLRDHFNDIEIDRILRHLSIKDLYKIEAMFTHLDHQLKSAKQSHLQNGEDLESTLESILEVSGNTILDEIDKILAVREQRALELGQQLDPVLIDEEGAVLDDFQEFVFSLHQKYSDRVPLAKENQSVFETAENVSQEVESPVEPILNAEVKETPEVPEEASELFNVNEQEGESHGKDVGPGEDAGHFNKNEDVQAVFQDTAEIQRGPQAILENPLDLLGFEIDPSSDSLDSSRPSDFSENSANYEQASTSTLNDAQDWFLFASEYLGVYAQILIAALPEEWQPGPTFHGLPWKPVLATAVVGVLTVLMFLWRTVLAVKNRTYLLTEKQLAARIQQLVSEKSDVIRRVTELNNSIKEHEEKLNNSEESRCSLQKQFNELETHYKDLNNQKEKLSGNFAQLYEKIANTQEENKTLNEKISTMHQGIQKYQKTLKGFDEERSKMQILMDEAKLREDALKAQVLSFEKDNCALKEQKKSLLRDAKDWQEKHEKLSEEIKVYQKTQKELENALVHKENEMDVLSGCIAELKSLESHNDTEEENDKNGDPLKLHLKQMMDVSRIKATLSVIEEERNRWFENFMAEQKARQELEEKFQKVIHDQTNLKSEKTQLENQYKNLQQRLEITTELYHQKENILHQKLTQEELERHEKETKLSEVDGRALQAEEELNLLRQKVKDMQEEMQQNERSLKAEIAVQEKKAHENWLKARASERTLIEEKRECANLRQKIVECSDKMSELEHALYKSGPPDRHMPPQQRGDSYGPSPVSGGAPSPPLMIEDPGRPPSGPVLRRSEPFGPRLFMDGHGRPADLGHPLPFRPELSAPRTSSPCTQDGPMSKSQRQGSFLPSPIRDSPVPAPNPLPKAYGPQPMGGPLPSLNGPLPPASRPLNGHPPMMPPGPPFGPDTGFRTPHMDSFRPPFPLRPPYGPIPPRFVHGQPMRDFPSMNPHPSAHGMPDFPPNYTGPQDLSFPPRPYPSGPLPPPGVMVPPSSGAYGPPTPQQPRDGQKIPHATEAPPEQRAAQDTLAPAVPQS